MKTLLRNGLVLTEDYSGFEKRDLLLQEDLIKAVEPWGTVAGDQADQIVDLSGKLVIPGLINAHGHSYAGILKGSIGAIPLDIYMLYAIAGGSARSERAIYVSAMIDAVQMLKNGITSFVDHFSQRPTQEPEGIDAVVRAFLDSGIRARVAPMYSDKSFAETVPFPEKERLSNAGSKPNQSPQEYVRVVDEAIGRWSGADDRVRLMLGTDGPQRCTDELLGLTKELEAQHRCGWQTHVLEAKTQAVMSNRLYGKGLVEHMAQDLGVLNERTSLVHAVWLSDREIGLTAEAGAAVVHCPRSNLYLGSGAAPLLAYKKAGVPVALGTDGGNLGALEMFEVIRTATLMHRFYEVDYQDWPTASGSLRTGYEGGARVMQADVGVVAPGAKADLTILDGRSEIFWPRRDLVKQLVYYENGSSVDTVIVDGTFRVVGGRVLGIDEPALREEAQEIADTLGLTGSDAPGPSESELERFRAMYLDVMKRDLGMDRFHG